PPGGRTMRKGCMLAVAWVGIASASAAAQDLTKPDTAAQRSAHLFTRHDAYIAGAFAAGAVAMFPLDRTLASHLQDSTVQANRFLSHAATAARRVGSPGAFALPFVTYVGGRVLHRPQV